MTNDRRSASRLRLWPGVLLAGVLVLAHYVLPALFPTAEIFAVPMLVISVAGGVICGLAIAVWWLFASHTRWSERLSVAAVGIVALAVTWLTVHESIRGGFMGNLLFIYAIPVIGLTLVATAYIGRHLQARTRASVMAVAITIASLSFTVLRTDGITGDANSLLHWRWTPTPEARLLAAERLPGPRVGNTAPPRPAPDATSQPAAPAEMDAAERKAADKKPMSGVATDADAARGNRPDRADAPGAPVVTREARASGRVERRVEWEGFRGPARDGVIRGVRIDTDWSTSPPIQIWRRPIGPGWSSFAVSGDFIYTQEQRGEAEIVSCYRLSTGEPVWAHRDAVRFYESNGGAGPRGTPTLHDGRIYSVGATGILNALDAATGARLWSRNTPTDTGKQVPDWGITSSPIVVDDLVVVAVAGQLAAYDVSTGEPRWIGQSGGAGYSSPHLASIDGVDQILLIRGSRTISVDPSTGTLLWDHSAGPPSVGIVQPAVLGDGSVLISTGDAMGGLGMWRIAVSRDEGGWHVAERWASRGLKPYFNDFVVHEGHAYGFDGSILAAIDLSDGTRKWKGGRYGNGQMLLLPEQDLLLVLSEDGDLALVSATPDKFQEVARHLAALNAKTWNHHVLVGDVLLIRNGEEMAAFRLPMAR